MSSTQSDVVTRPKILLTTSAIDPLLTDLPLLFKEAGCEVEIHCPCESGLLRNRAWDVWHDSTYSSREYLDGLRELVSHGYDWVVFTDDETLTLVDSRLSGDDLRQLLPIFKRDSHILLGSKAGLARMCDIYNLSTPKTRVFNGTSVEAICDSLSFPILLKVDHSLGGAGVYFCANTRDVSRTVQTLTLDERRDLVFQEYVEGDNIASETLFKNGRLLSYTHALVLQNTDGEFSVSTLRNYSYNTEFERLLVHVGQELGLHGFCSMTFIREKKTGEYYLVEADPRPHPWFFLARFANVDFSIAIQNFLHDNDQVVRPPTQDIRVRYFFRDFKRALIQKDIREILRWCIGTDGRWRFIPWHDRVTFWYTALLVSKELIRRLPFFKLIHRLMNTLTISVKNRFVTTGSRK